MGAGSSFSDLSDLSHRYIWIGALPTFALVCVLTLILTRQLLGTRCKVVFVALEEDAQTCVKVCIWMAIAGAARVVWFLLKATDVTGEQSGADCVSGPDCLPKVFTSLNTRVSQLMFFVCLCASMRLCVRATHARALGAVSAAGIASMFHNQIRALPPLAWDVSHMALDTWMLLLQFVLLLTTTSATVPAAEGDQIYLSYELQIVCMYACVCVLYGMTAFHFSDLIVESAGNVICCRRRNEVALVAAERRAARGYDSASARLLDHAHTQTNGNTYTLNGSPGGKASGAAKSGVVPAGDYMSPAEVRATAAYSQLAWTFLVISCLCFLRAFLFAWMPINGSPIKGDASIVLYPLFFYSAPEVGGSLLLLNLLMPRGLLTPFLCCRRCCRDVDLGSMCACPIQAVSAVGDCASRCTHTAEGHARCSCGFYEGRWRCKIRR